jgi:hypothetical protein
VAAVEASGALGSRGLVSSVRKPHEAVAMTSEAQRARSRAEAGKVAMVILRE